MFRRARIRLTALYVVLFAVVIAVFSVVFYVGFLIVLPPAFDLAPDLTSEQVAAVAYQTTVERIGLALLGADVVVIAAVAVAAWVLAARTLEPIREAHARQRRFVADASHEMRTPLAAILSSAEGAIATARTPDELRHALNVDARAARSLTAITNDLLLLARSDELPSDRREPIDLSVVVAETVEAFARVHPELPSIRMSFGPDLRVSADPAEIGRIVSNLLDNARALRGRPEFQLGRGHDTRRRSPRSRRDQRQRTWTLGGRPRAHLRAVLPSPPRSHVGPGKRSRACDRAEPRRAEWRPPDGREPARIRSDIPPLAARFT